MSEQPPYVLSAAFRRPERAKAVYRQAEALLYDQPVDLSAYNLELNGQPLVVVLGNPPPATVHDRLARLLATGQPIAVPEEVLITLYRRSRDAWAKGPWQAYHHRPGQHLPVEEE